MHNCYPHLGGAFQSFFKTSILACGFGSVVPPVVHVSWICALTQACIHTKMLAYKHAFASINTNKNASVHLAMSSKSHIYTSAHAHMHACMFTHMITYVHTCMGMQAWVYLQMHVCAHAYVQTHICACVCTHENMCTCMHALLCNAYVHACIHANMH